MSNRFRLAFFLGFFLLGAAWAFAAPYGGPPDEAEHVIRAAGVARGQVVASLTDSALGTGAFQTVPRGLLTDCAYQLRPEQSAACAGKGPGDDDTPVRVATRAGRYHPAYYAVVGWPLRWWPDWTGVALSRLLTAALVAALLTAAVDSAARWSPAGVGVAGVIVAATPLLFHLAGAVNPAGVEIAAGVLLFAAGIPLLTLARAVEPDRALIRRVGIAAVVLATTRAFGPIWLAIALAVLLLPPRRAALAALWRDASARRWGLAVVLAVAAGVAWTIARHATVMTRSPAEASTAQALKHIVFARWPAWAQEMVGRMSFNDTELPGLAYGLWYAAFGLLVLGGLFLGTWTQRWRLVVLALAGYAVPTVSDALAANTYGFISQGRYLLPLLVGLPLLAAHALGDVLDAGRVRPLIRGLAVLLLPVHAVALWITMIRWQRGIPPVARLMPVNPLRGEWLPVLGPVTPLVTMGIGLVVLGGGYWLIASRAAREPSCPSDQVVPSLPATPQTATPIPTSRPAHVRPAGQ